MSEAENTPFQFTVHIISPEYDPGDSEWQTECRQFYDRLVTALADEDGLLEPATQPAPKGSKTDLVTLFDQIVTYGVSIGAFSALYQLAKLWLEQRSRCDIELKFPDGSTLNMRGLSWAEAEQKMQEHQAKWGTGGRP